MRIAEDVETMIISALRRAYSTYDQILPYPGAREAVPIESHYVNLALLTTKEQEEKERSEKGGNAEDSKHPDLLRPHARIEVKEHIQLSELFAVSRRVLLQGRAGVGKSTLSQYIAYHWSKKELWPQKFVAIFWLPLRELPRMMEGWNRGSGITPQAWVVYQKYFAMIPGMKPKHIDALLAKEGDRILWLLDGYDEIAQVSESSDVANVGIQQVLQALVSQPHVLMTTRPGFYQMTIAGQPCRFDARIEITGLTEENIKAYLAKHFPDGAIANTVLQYIKKNDTIYGLAHTPLNLGLLVKLLTQRQGAELQLKLPETLTGLYSDLLSDWLLRHRQEWLRKERNEALSSYEDFVVDEEMGVSLALLECIAYEGMKNPNLLIGADTVQKAERQVAVLYSLGRGVSLLKDSLAIGLLKELGQEERKENRQYYFLHLTFQEYFAACWVKRVLSEANHSEKAEVEGFIRAKKYFPRYDILWSFVSGLTYQYYERHQDGLPMQRFFSQIDGSPRDLVGHAHTLLLMRCFREFNSLNHLPNDYIAGMVSELEEIVFRNLLKRHGGWRFSNNQLYPMATSTFRKRVWRSIEESLGGIEDIEQRGNLLKWLAPHMNTEQLRRVLDAERALLSHSHSNCAVRFDALSMMNELIPHLNPEQCGRVLETALALLVDSKRVVRRNALSVVEKLIPHLSRERIASELEAARDLLDNPDRGVREAALSVMEKLIPHLSRERIASDMEAARALLSDTDWTVRWESLSVMKELTLHLNPEQIARVLEAALALWADRDRDVRRKALSVMEKLIPQLSPEQRSSVLETALALWADRDGMVRWSALSVMEKLIPHLSPEQRGRVLEVALALLADHGWDVGEKVLSVMEKLIPHLSPEQRGRVLEAALALLADGVWCVRENARSVMEKLTPQLGPEQMDGVLEAVRALLVNRDVYVRRNALSVMEKLTPQFGPEQMDRVLEAARALLADPDWIVRENALSVMAELILHLNLEQIARALEAARALLADRNEEVRRNALFVMRKLISHLSPDQRGRVLEAARDLWTDSDGGVRANALSVMEALIPQLSSEQADRVLEAARALLADCDWNVRRKALFVMKKLMPSLNAKQIAAIAASAPPAGAMWYDLPILFLLRLSLYGSAWAKAFFDKKALIFLDETESSAKTICLIAEGQYHHYTLSDSEWEQARLHLLPALKAEAQNYGLPSRVYDYGMYSAPIAIPGGKQKTLLHWAAEYGNVEELRRLLEKEKRNINDQGNADKVTPLMLACAYPGEVVLTMAVLLIEAGADVNLLDKSNATVLWQLSDRITKAPGRFGGYQELDKLLREQSRPSSSSASSSVSSSDRWQPSQAFWQAIINDEAANFDEHYTPAALTAIHPNRGLTPLQLAIEERSTGCVKKLLALGADLKQKNPVGVDAWTILKRCLEQTQFYAENPAALKLFHYLLRERKPEKAMLDRAINALFVLFSDERTPLEAKEKALSEQLSILLGMSAEDIQKDYDSEPMRLQYQMYLKDYKKIEQAYSGSRIEGQAGNNLDKFLCLRIRLYLFILMEGEAGKWSNLPLDERGQAFSIQEILTRLRREILTDLEIYWQEKARQACMNLSPEHQEEALKTMAENIIRQSGDLPIGSEYSFYSGYQIPGNAHCIYISLEKVSENSVIVRVDNRWTQGNRRDGQYHTSISRIITSSRMDASGEIIATQNRMEYLQPYYIGHFKLTDNKLNTYLTGCLQAVSITPANNSDSAKDEAAIKAIEKIYPWPTVQAYHSPRYANMREACLQRWPSQPRQQDGMGNCTLSSHNYGVVSRLGQSLSLWLFDKELSIIVQQGAIRGQSGGITRTGTILRGAEEASLPDAEIKSPLARYYLTSSGFFSRAFTGSSQSNAAVSGEESVSRLTICSQPNSSVPTHDELMNKLMKVLDTAWNEVYIGCAVETAIVSLAGIETSQQGAQFRRTKEGDEQFLLRFKDAEEYDNFLNYYRSTYPELIKEARCYTQPFSQVILDTHILDQALLPALDAHQKKIGKLQELSSEKSTQSQTEQSVKPHPGLFQPTESLSRQAKKSEEALYAVDAKSIAEENQKWCMLQ